MILSHYRAGTGAVLVEGREEHRFLRVLLGELPRNTEVGVVAAPSGQAMQVTLLPDKSIAESPLQRVVGLAAAYEWAKGRPGRVLVVWDWHVLCNNPGHWRMLIEALPGLRSPKDGGSNDPASLVVFVAPSWELSAQNPLRGAIPVLQFDPPDRQSLSNMAAGLAPLNGNTEAVADALAGLAADVAEQAAAECLVAHQGWNVPHLLEAKKRILRQNGLEIWDPAPDLGGLQGFRDFVATELVPWVGDWQLCPRRILCAGLPGGGKSFCGRNVAYQLHCLCARFSPSACKSRYVGDSQAAFRRVLGTFDVLAAEAPLVAILDEIDSIKRDGSDAGTTAEMFSQLLTWLQESKSKVIVIGTLNHLDALDAALESRFDAKFFFDLPSAREREAVAAIHYRMLGIPEDLVAAVAQTTATASEGFSSREIAQSVCRTVARRSGRKPNSDLVLEVCREVTPASTTQSEQLRLMRQAASTLRLANDPPVASSVSGRRVQRGGDQ